jgi:hypothetical protein
MMFLEGLKKNLSSAAFFCTVSTVVFLYGVRKRKKAECNTDFLGYTRTRTVKPPFPRSVVLLLETTKVRVNKARKITTQMCLPLASPASFVH